MYPEEFEIPSVMTFDERADFIKDYIKEAHDLGYQTISLRRS